MAIFALVFLTIRFVRIHLFLDLYLVGSETKSSVADPKLLISDPDPTWRVLSDPDPTFQVVSDPDSWPKKFVKFACLKSECRSKILLCAKIKLFFNASFFKRSFPQG